MVTAETIEEVMRLRSEGKTQRQIAKLANVRTPTIRRIIKGTVSPTEEPDREPFVRMPASKHCAECGHWSTLWDSKKNQCWACGVREL